MASKFSATNAASSPKKLAKPDPLYAQVQRTIAEEILSGRWKRGSQIPGEVEISELFGVSVGTTRRALTNLVSNGFLERRPRLGTIVSERSSQHDLGLLFNYYRLHANGEDLVMSSTRILSMETSEATAQEQEMLKLKPDQKEVTRIKRVRTVDGEPVMHENIVLPIHLFPNLPEVDELPDLLYQFYGAQYGIRIASARESLSAAVANERDCELLAMTDNEAVLVIDTIAFDKTHKPVEWRILRATTEGYRYINEIR
ncbi:MAG: GntR family transcriptional regulator [Hyphomicrobiales bacterium]|nr:MAG: GntR family transcriptional regulator [Hyphomicrobiales bacterium]